MASPSGVCLGFLLLVLCLAHGSARNIISNDLMPNEYKRQLNQESPMTPPSRSLEPEPEPASGTPPPSPSGALVPELVTEDGNESFDDSLAPDSLDDDQVACGHPACRSRPKPRPRPLPVVPNCPSCGCTPVYDGGMGPIPYPFPRCEPASSPQPEPFYPPQPEPLYPPQPEPMYPPQPEPLYPPQPEPLYPPQPEPMYPPQPEPMYPPQPEPMYPPQPEPMYPPQVSPGCQPAAPPQISPGCQPASPCPQPAASPCQQPAVSPCQPEPTYPPWPEYPPQPEPFYPPQPEPTNPPITGPRVDANCVTLLGRKCSGTPSQDMVQQWADEKPPPNEVMLESIREMENMSDSPDFQKKDPSSPSSP